MKTMYLVVTITMAFLTSAVYAGGAHCYCKLGPLSAPIYNFGEIEHWATQNGHDGACRDSCNTKADAYMRDTGRRTAACNATHGATVVAYSAVGTRAYQAGGTYNCPQSNPTPSPGSISFPPRWGQAPWITVNEVGINPNAIPPFGFSVSKTTPFTTFTFRDRLSMHVQAWTFTARLYRDNVLVEELTGKSPAASFPDVLAIFTGQPNSIVHLHTWKITTHYAGPNYTDRSASLFITP